VVGDKVFLGRNQVVAMQTLGRRAKGRPALEWMPQICVFCTQLPLLIDGKSPHQ
jgi:hypothetical protein